MVKLKNNYIACLDIGTSKTACALAEIDSYGNIELLAANYQSTSGYRAGTITDVKSLCTSIIATINNVEEQAGQRIEKIYVNISASKIYSHHISSQLYLGGRQITKSDIQRLILDGLKKIEAKGDREVIHYFPLDYIINDEEGIQQPVDMFGNIIKSHLHIISTEHNNIANLAATIGKCHLNIENFVASPLAAGLSCLTSDEKELGAILLDMGASHTSIGIFYEGKLASTTYLPFAGNAITSDISEVFGADLATSERIKIIYGTALATSRDETRMVDIPQTGDEHQHEHNQASQADISAVIRPRVEEIFELAKKKLLQAGIDHNFFKRIVLTGGTSQLTGIREVAGSIFGKTPRLAFPLNLKTNNNEFKGPAFAVLAGMLEFAAQRNHQQLHIESKNSNRFASFMHWVKENF